MIAVTRLNPSPTAEEIDAIFDFLFADDDEAMDFINPLRERHGDTWAIVLTETILQLLECTMRL